MLEVYHFARDAAIAEAWLVAQESFVKSPDLGDSLDETLALLKKHLAFEKAVATQEERFIALQKETMVRTHKIPFEVTFDLIFLLFGFLTGTLLTYFSDPIGLTIFVFEDQFPVCSLFTQVYRSLVLCSCQVTIYLRV